MWVTFVSCAQPQINHTTNQPIQPTNQITPTDDDDELKAGGELDEEAWRKMQSYEARSIDPQTLQEVGDREFLQDSWVGCGEDGRCRAVGSFCVLAKNKGCVSVRRAGMRLPLTPQPAFPLPVCLSFLHVCVFAWLCCLLLLLLRYATGLPAAAVPGVTAD